MILEQDPDWDDEDSILVDFTCLCIVGIEDPVRQEVRYTAVSIAVLQGDNLHQY